ncbi:MAG: fused MFS/spermidine synthase [Planctomycetota bacterium]|jgi:predicted membrane-bound spermidine synthase/Tfp pilus assembly protein PilF
MQKGNFSKIIIPSLTVFLSSACIMIIELVASRLIARHLGSSLYTWTSVIGVVLAGITIGNYLGGRIADKYQPRKALSTLFCLASIACVVIIILNNIIGEWIWLWQLSWPMRVFGHITLVFLAPSVLLGTISPVVAKMALDRGLPAGRTVGDIYAFGAAGSIAGTFLAGFYLIAAMGTIAIIWTVAFFLLAMALAYRIKAWPVYLWAVILVVFFFLGSAKIAFAEATGSAMLLREKHDSNILYENETPYCYVAVKQVSQEPDIRMFLQDKLKHSEISMDDITDLQYFYTKIFAALTVHATQNIESPSFLVIGGGGYAFPQFLQKNWPDSHIDVAEIDPGVTEAAHAAFGLPRNTTIHTIGLDARNHIDDVVFQNQTEDAGIHYDVIFEDAINDYSVPFQLVTKDFNEKIKDIISENGLYLINLIDTYDNAQFLGAIITTVKETFPFVQVISNAQSMDELRETYVVAASFQPFDPAGLMAAYDPTLRVKIFNGDDYAYVQKKSKGIVLTDDYAPVENLLAPVVRQSARELIAAKYLTMARKFKSEANFEESIAYFARAAENNPSATILAYNEIGTLKANLNKPQEAAQAFKTAIDYYYEGEGQQEVIGSLHLNLAILHARMGNSEESNKQFALAIERFKEEVALKPKDHVLMNRLGDTYAMTGQLGLSSKYFRKALELAPDNHQYYGNLIKSLVMQNRTDEAVDLLKQQRDLLRQQGNQQGLQQVEQYLQQLLNK